MCNRSVVAMQSENNGNHILLLSMGFRSGTCSVQNETIQSLISRAFCKKNVLVFAENACRVRCSVLDET